MYTEKKRWSMAVLVRAAKDTSSVVVGEGQKKLKKKSISGRRIDCTLG